MRTTYKLLPALMLLLGSGALQAQMEISEYYTNDCDSYSIVVSLSGSIGSFTPSIFETVGNQVTEVPASVVSSNTVTVGSSQVTTILLSYHPLARGAYRLRVRLVPPVGNSGFIDSQTVDVTTCTLQVQPVTYRCPNIASFGVVLEMPRQLPPPSGPVSFTPPALPTFSASNFLVNETPSGSGSVTILSGPTASSPASGLFSQRISYSYQMQYNTLRTSNYQMTLSLQTVYSTVTSPPVTVAVQDCAIQTQLLIRGIGTADCTSYNVFYDLLRASGFTSNVLALRVQIGSGPRVPISSLAMPGNYGFSLPPAGSATVQLEADIEETGSFGTRVGTVRATTTAQACRLQLESITRNECNGSIDRTLGLRLAITAPTYQLAPSQPPASGADNSIFRLATFSLFEPELAAPSARSDFSATTSQDTTVYRMTLTYNTRKLNPFNVFASWNPAGTAFQSGTLAIPAIVCFRPSVEIGPVTRNDCGLIEFQLVYIVAPGSSGTVRLSTANVRVRETPAPDGSTFRDYAPSANPILNGVDILADKERMRFTVQYFTLNRPTRPDQEYRLQAIVEGQIYDVSINVRPVCNLNTSCPAQGGGTADTVYRDQFGPANNNYTWTLAACPANTPQCRLPNGLSILANGTVQGIPTELGQFNFAATATAPNGFSETRTCGFGVSRFVPPEQPLIISCPTVAQGRALEPFQTVIVASGGGGGYTFFVSGGVLPPGLTLRSDGTIFGVPTLPGTFTIGVRDENGKLATVTCPIVIAPAQPVAVAGSCPSVRSVAGLTFDPVPFRGVGGSGIYTVSATGLPTGLVVQNGMLAGTPQQPGSFEFSIVATDTRGVASTPLVCRLTVEEFTASQPQNAVRGCGTGAFPLEISGTGFVNPIEVFLGSRSLGVVRPQQDRISISVPADAVNQIGSQTVRLQQQGVPKFLELNLVVAGISGLAPLSTIVPASTNGSLEVTFTGAGFTSATEVRFGSTNLRPSQVSPDATRITVMVPFSLLQVPGIVPIVDTGALNCQPLNFLVRGITRLSRDRGIAESAGFTLVIDGEGFESGATVQFGSTTLPANLINPQRLEVPIPATQLQSPGAVIVNVRSGGELFNPRPFTIAGILSVEPGTIQAGSATVLTINGVDLDPLGPVTAGSLTLPPQPGGSSTRLQVQLTAAQTATLSGALEVRALSGGERTNAKLVTVRPTVPVPSVVIQPDVLLVATPFRLVIRLENALPFNFSVTVQGIFTPNAGVSGFTPGNLPGFPLTLVFPAGQTEASRDLSGLTVAGTLAFTAAGTTPDGTAFSATAPPRTIAPLKPVITRSCLESADNSSLRLRLEGFSNTRSITSVRYQFRVANSQGVEGLAIDATGAQAAFATHFGTATSDAFAGGQFALSDVIRITNGSISLIQAVSVTIDNGAPGSATVVEVQAGSRCN